jgi:hypothetical protein
VVRSGEPNLKLPLASPEGGILTARQSTAARLEADIFFIKQVAA